jgi:TRIAD3 protein (E3 ubiquitin-protein ligase RNF216)
MIKVSDSVKQAEDARKGQAHAEAHAFPYHMVANQLRRVGPPPGIGVRPLPLPPPPAPFHLPVAPAGPAQYVPPYHVAPAPVHGHPVQHYPAFPIYYFAHPVPMYHPGGNFGAMPRHLVAPCPRCHLYHAPNRHC